MDPDKKKDSIIEDINDLFSDRSVDLDKALELQQEIASAAEMNAAALQDDIRRRDEGEN